MSAVSGVYLILAQNTRDVYIESAHGNGGIWGGCHNVATLLGSHSTLNEFYEEDSPFRTRDRRVAAIKDRYALRIEKFYIIL